MTDYPNDGFIRVFTSDFSKSDVIPVTIKSTAGDVNAKLGSGAQLHVRLSNGTERQLKPDEFPFQILIDMLVKIGYTSAEAAIESKEDHSYAIRFHRNRSILAVPEETVVIKGMLIKEGHGMFKKWEERFCMIKGTKFIYFENPNAAKPLGEIVLTGCKVTEEEDKKRTNVFGIYTKDKNYFFSCDSATERKNWLSKVKPIAGKSPYAVTLSQNSYESIPAIVLQENAASCQTLDLSKNFIMPAQDFSAFRALTNLNLSENGLSEIPTSIFSLNTLVELDVSRNQLRSLPVGIAKLANLKTLAVHSNNISTLPNELRTLSLKTLMIAFNDFVEIPQVVTQLSTLHQLIATANRLSSLPESIGDLANLQLLDVRYNQLSTLPSSMSRLAALTRLDIRQNKFTAVPDVVLSLSALESLDCGPNNLSGRTLNVNLPALKSLRCVEAGIATLSLVANPANLTKLNLSDNNLVSLPEVICDLPNLESIVAKNNKLKALPAKIFNIPSLKWLYVGYNQIESIPEKFGKCLIQLFEIQHNRLKSLPAKLLRVCYMLRVLNVSNNEIEEIPNLNETEELNAIEELYIGQNKLNSSALEIASGMPKLRLLDCSYNKGTLTSIPPSISKLAELQGLSVAGNDLAELPKTLNKLKKLKFLLANNNLLRDIPPLPESLNHLDIGCNRISVFPDAVISKLPQLNLLDVSGNYKLILDGSPHAVSAHGLPNACTLSSVTNPQLTKIVAEAISGIRNINGDLLKKIEGGGSILGDAWSYGSADILGRRLRMEDTQVKMRRIRGDEFQSVFGIFDGHSGPSVAERIASVFPNVFEDELGKIGANADYATLLRRTFLSTNQKISPDIGHRCGSTGAVAYLARQDNGTVALLGANVGDTEMLLCRGGSDYLLLSKKHSLALEEERERVLALNGFFSDDDRVNGILATSRVFGDQYLNPYVVPNPHVQAVFVQPTDEFLIVACDGLWDVVSYEYAIEIVRSVPDPVSAAKKLRDLAYLYGSEDNITVQVIKFGKYVPENTSEDDAAEAAAAKTLAERANAQASDQSSVANFFKDYTYVKVLGQGSFGKVILAQGPIPGSGQNGKAYVAVKTIEKTSTNAGEIALERSMEKIRHPSLAALYTSFETSTKAYLVMEYVGGGTFSVPDSPKDAFPEKAAKFYAAQIASGLKYLHKNRMVYRDMALHNLLLDSKGNVKIIDFGLASANITAKDFAGTPGFMAPEMVSQQSCDKAVDWWSLGVVLYMMLVGRPPFFADDIIQLRQRIVNEEPYLPHSLSKPGKAVLKSLLEKNPTNRLGALPDDSDIEKHPFFKDIDFAKLDAGQIKPPRVPDVKPIQSDSSFSGWEKI